MKLEDVLRMAAEAQPYRVTDEYRLLPFIERFAALVAAAERNKLAAWMIQRSYTTGHGDTTEDLLKELDWQVRESEREACAKVCDEQAESPALAPLEKYRAGFIADAIRARGQT